ncbi:hypothetical protein GCM10027598_60250 [Amycolatopsis oliviviridis]|uniref:Uncharacterized protein n=1 Tax=Amycolatopsis oliviviridis TaxID=1471590 RepID=A0ABQ3ML66_9PSEU|nr:hypothetical protein [Amycolatopsis oliviviridis]GHH38122.1 hypothetical protein GCM10017790_83420 [Amycolatopsis oliviviridis]
MKTDSEPLRWATRIVTRDHDGEIARGLLDRYRAVHRSPAIVSAMLDLAAGWDKDPLEAKRVFEMKRSEWEDEGGFLEKLGTEEIGRWILSDDYVVAEAAPHLADDGGRFEAVAQRVYRLPGSDWIIPVLDAPGNEIYDRQLYDEMAEAGPLSTASFDYGGVLPEWAGQGAAGAARHTGFTEVIRRCAEAEIRFLVGWIYSIQGLVLHDPVDRAVFGDRLALERFAQPPIINRRSLETNMGSRRLPATLLGLRRDTPPVPVVHGERRYGLDVHWYVLAIPVRSCAP